MNILVIHASAGAGHTKAAEALYEGLRDQSDQGVQIVDALDYTSASNKAIYRKTYALLVTKFSWAWGFFFKISDYRQMQPLIKAIRRIFNSLTARKLERFLIDGHFDYILSTHFFPNEVASRLKVQGKIASKIISVITDFDVHPIWVQEAIDYYTVACGDTRDKLLSLGVKKEMICVTGIPTQRKFQQDMNREDLRRKFGLPKKGFTVLVATGSFGMGPIEAMISDLAEFQLLIVCGSNQSLHERLRGNPCANVKVFGLVDNMHELMSVADCLITKPGGLSISEALVKGLPMIFFCAIPGQETNNIRILRQHGIGIVAENPQQIAIELRRLNFSQDEMTAARKNIAHLARPGAVEAIKALVV